MTPGPALVWGRAAVVGSVGLGSGIASHLLGGGHLPGTLALLVLLAVSVAVSAAFLLTWAGPARLVLLVVAAQTGWHLVLSVLAGHAGDAPSTAATVPPPLDLQSPATGNLYDAYLASVPTGPPAPGQDVLAHQLDHLAGQGVLMVLAHLLGAVALGLFLGVGERHLWRLLLLALARAGAALGRPRPFAAVLTPLRGSGRPRCAPTLRTSQVLVRSTLLRRGPPALLAA